MVRTAFGRILLIWLAGLGAAAQYGKVSVVYDQLPGLYPGAGATLGFAVSLVGLVGIVFGVVAGLLVARIGYRRALLWAMWGGAAISAVQALLPPLPVLLALRAVEGASHLAIVVAAPTLIAQLSAPRHAGFTLSLWSTFFGVAYTALVYLGLPLVAWQGIPALFAAHALWMAALALALGRVLEPLGERVPEARLTLTRVVADHGAIYRSPRISAPAIGWLFYTFCFLGILTLIPPYIAEPLRLPVLGAMPLVSIAVSMTAGVVLIRWMGAVRVILLGFAVTTACMLWLLAAPGLPMALLCLAGGFGLVQGASFAAVPQLNVSAEHRAQANGAMAQMGNIGNTLGTPGLALAAGVAGHAGLMALAAGLFVLGGGAHLWLAARRGRT
jgi:MFS family permease